MLEEFDVDIARGLAMHKPTRHIFHFRPTKPVDAVEIIVWRENREVERSPLEIIREAREAIRRAMRHAGYT